jgi:hypothetical protein
VLCHKPFDHPKAAGVPNPRERWNLIALGNLTIKELLGGGCRNDRIAAVMATRRSTGDALGRRFRPANEFSGIKQEQTLGRAVAARGDLHGNAFRRGRNLVWLDVGRHIRSREWRSALCD